MSQLSWDDVPYAGGVFAAACTRAGHTCQPVPVAVDLTRCTNCNWMRERLPLRREALDAAQLHPGRGGVRRRDPSAARGASHPPGRRPPATATRSSYLQLDPNDYRVVRRQRRHRGEDRHPRRRRDGNAGDPAALGSGLSAAMPPAVGRHFSANGDRVTMAAAGRGQGPRPARARTRARRRLRRLPDRQADQLHDLRLPRPERARVLALRLAADLLSADHEHPLWDGVDGPPDWFGIDKRDLTSRWRSWLTIARDDRGRQRRRLRPAAPDRQLHAHRAGSGSASYGTTSRRRPSTASTCPTRRAGRS